MKGGSLAFGRSPTPSYISNAPLPPPSSVVGTHCSAVVIKPHAVAAKAAGPIIDALLRAGLEISAARSLILSAEDANDYLDAYRGVYPQFTRWVGELASGPSVALEVRGEGVVEAVREIAGPFDPEVARVLQPGALRARYGLDAVRNAMHVTDIAVDGPLECKFFFHVLA